MNFEDSFYNYSKDNFYEYFSNIQNMLQSTNVGYKEIILKKNKLLENNPKIEKIFLDRESVSLTLEECNTLIELLDIQDKIIKYEDEAIYLMGGYEAYVYFSKLGILKK